MSGDAVRHLMVVLANARPGRAADLDRWYQEEHLPEVVAVDGFAAAQQFSRSPGFDDACPFQHLAVYEITSATLDEAVAALTAARPSMSSTDALADDVAVWWFGASGERIESSPTTGPDAD